MPLMRLPSPRTRTLAALACALTLAAAALAQNTPATPPRGAITSGWTLLKEGQAEGTVEHPAKHASNPSANLLKISVTKYAAHPGEGRIGAKNSNAQPVQQGQWYDITFNGISEGIGVGLVFSLESADGKVLARTTLPEIGRGGRGGGGRGRRGGPPGATTAPAEGAATTPAAASAPPTVGPTWRPYLISLFVRESAPAAHLTVTPIEPVPVWIDNLALNLRQPTP